MIMLLILINIFRGPPSSMAIRDVSYKSFAFIICKSNALDTRVLYKQLARRTKINKEKQRINEQRNIIENTKIMKIKSNFEADDSSPVSKVQQIACDKMILSSSSVSCLCSDTALTFSSVWSACPPRGDLSNTCLYACKSWKGLSVSDSMLDNILILHSILGHDALMDLIDFGHVHYVICNSCISTSWRVTALNPIPQGEIALVGLGVRGHAHDLDHARSLTRILSHYNSCIPTCWGTAAELIISANNRYHAMSMLSINVTITDTCWYAMCKPILVCSINVMIDKCCLHWYVTLVTLAGITIPITPLSLVLIRITSTTNLTRDMELKHEFEVLTGTHCDTIRCDVFSTTDHHTCSRYASGLITLIGNSVVNNSITLCKSPVKQGWKHQFN